MRSGIAQFEDLPYRDNAIEPVIGAMVQGLDPELPRTHRLLELLALALQETLETMPSLPFESVPLIICLAEPDRPGGGGHLAGKFVGAIQRKLGVRFHPANSGVVVEGHTSGFEALRIARQLLHAGDIPACLICAVDSYINAISLNWLDEHWRLKTEENPDGVIPGECAAAMLVTPAATGKAVKVLGLGFGHEEAAVLTDEPLLGLGMTEAVTAALAESGQQMHEFDFRMSDATGESYGFREQALALTRAMRVRRDEFPVWHCADSIGDIGAAAGICQMVLLADAFAKGYAPGPMAICFTSSVTGKRATCIVEKAVN